MIYNNKNIKQMINGKNPDSNEQLVANQFVWLLNNKRSDVVDALRDAGIDVEDEIEPIKLKGIMEQAVIRYNASQDQVAKKAIFNVSSLISDEAKSGFYSNMVSGLENMDINAEPKTVEKKKLPSLDDVLKIGNLLIGAFGGGKVSNEAVTSGSTSGTMPTQKKGISTGKIIALSIGGLLLIGGGIFIYKMVKNNK